MADQLSAAWDAQYAAGRYWGDPPVAFVHEIIGAASEAGARHGLYIGCGNGRNYIPLVEAGLHLVGLDVSPTALGQLAQRMGVRASPLIVGDLNAIADGSRFDLVVAIQVFQHGDRARAHANIQAAQRLVGEGGLFCIRVNSVSTFVYPAHEIVDEAADGSFTVRYVDGPKAGLDIHFFSGEEVRGLFSGWSEIRGLQEREHPRVPPSPGQWTQWEAIYARSARPEAATR